MPAYETAKGIVVDVGMDVAGLKKALGSINTETNAIQRELKQVERLLKLDPTNTELLAQKQKLLQDSIQNTTVKLAAMKSAQKQLADAPNVADEAVQKEYRQLQREIIETEKQIKDLSKELKRTDDNFKEASKNSDNFQGKLKNLAKTAADVDEKLGGKLTKTVETLGVAAAAAGVAATKSFMDFSEETVKVRTLLDETVMSYDEAKKSILNWSVQGAMSAKQVANAMYEALSAGVKTADISKFMEQAVQTAVAGSTDIATAVDVLTTILNSYGLSVEQVTLVSDKLLLAQDKGKVTVGEFSDGLGNLVGIASEAGVSLEEILSAVAALTASGQAPSSAINSLKAAISNIIKPSAEAEETAKKLRIGFDAQSLSAKGLSGMLENVAQKTNGNTENMAKLFGSVEALNAVMILTGKGSKTFSETLGGMNNAAGKTAEIFALFTSESAFKFGQSLISLTGSLIEIGATLSPLLELIALIITAIAGVDPVILILIGNLMMTAAIVIQLAKALEPLSGLGGTVGKAFSETNLTMIKTVAVIMMVVAVLIALGAIIAVIIGRGDELKSTMASINSSVGQTQSTVNNAGRLPKYAVGTNYHLGGRAMVGEYGPEIVDLPRGSKVYTASQSQRMASEATSSNETYYVTIDAKSVKEFNDIVRIAKQKRQRSVAYGR